IASRSRCGAARAGCSRWSAGWSRARARARRWGRRRERGAGDMIDPALRFEGFDARSWTNLISLFAPELTDEDAARGVLLIVIDGRDRVLLALHTRRGRIDGLSWEGPSALPALAERYGARRCVALREGVIEEIGERVARRVDRGEDYLAQWLLV